MGKLGFEHVKTELAYSGPVASCRYEFEPCGRVDKSLNQPCARDAVDMNSLARDPCARAELSQRRFSAILSCVLRSAQARFDFPNERLGGLTAVGAHWGNRLQSLLPAFVRDA